MTVVLYIVSLSVDGEDRVYTVVADSKEEAECLAIGCAAHVPADFEPNWEYTVVRTDFRSQTITVNYVGILRKYD